MALGTPGGASQDPTYLRAPWRWKPWYWVTKKTTMARPKVTLMFAVGV